MADVYAADVLAATLQREADHLAGIGPVMHGRPAVAAEAQRDALLALVPDDQSLVIDRDGRVWGLEFGYFSSEGEMYRKVPVTSEEERRDSEPPPEGDDLAAVRAEGRRLQERAAQAVSEEVTAEREDEFALWLWEHAPALLADPPDSLPEGVYDGPIVEGMRFLWEPMKPHATEHLEVTRIHNGGVLSRSWERTSSITGGYTGMEVWNDESRFREAVVPVTEGGER